MLEKQTRLFKAISDPGRIRILKMLLYKPLCVCEITDILGLAASTVSNHLGILKEAGLIKDYKDGKWINYSICNEIKDPEVASIMTAFHFMAEDDEMIKEDRIKLGIVDRIEITNR